jgi:hypothetical protein
MPRKRTRKYIPIAWKKKRRKLMIFFGLFVLLGSITLILAVRENWFALGSDEAKKIVPETYSKPVVVSVGKKTLSILPIAGNDVKMVKKDVRYVFEGAYENTDVVQSIYPYKIKEELIFWGKGHPLEFRYKLGNVDKFIVKKDEKGNIKFYDKQTYEKSGELSKIFTIPTPFIEDKVGERSFVDVESRIEGDLLIITVNSDWLKQAVYPVILDPTIEINVLNVYSHPSQGQNWEVEFVTKGKADLKIIPQDQATIDDDEFIGLYCDQNIHEPIILTGDIIYYQNWECSGVGKVIHKTLKAGHHILKFEFSGVEGYAEDWAYNAPVAWYPSSGWTYRRTLHLDHTLVSGTANLSSFPALISFTDTALKASVSGGHVNNENGYDIIFTSSDGTTKLDHEIEKYTGSTGEIIMWARIPILTYANDTEIYIYYGNSSISTSQEAAAAVWDSNYLGVWHLKEDPTGTAPQMIESNNGNSLTATSLVAGDQLACQVDGGLSFNGSSKYATTGNKNVTVQNLSQYTISAWLYTGTLGARKTAWEELNNGTGSRLKFAIDLATAIGKTGTNTYFFFGGRVADADSFTNFAVNDSVAVALSTWYYVVAVFDSVNDVHHVMVNGTDVTNALAKAAIANTVTSQNPRMAARPGTAAEWWNGRIDEMRVSNTMRAVDWSKTEYNNYANQGTGSGKFIRDLGTEQVISIINIKGSTRIKGGTRLNLEDTGEKI